VSVIVGISAHTDFTLQNAAYRFLIETAFGRTNRGDDRRALEAPIWSHLLDLTLMPWEQARRLAWLLDDAAGVEVDARRAEGSESSLLEVADLEAFQSMLRETFGPPLELPDDPADSTEPAGPDPQPEARPA
jgi:hypothetical protein